MSNTSVIQVTNIAPSATNEQMKTLFGYLGTIKEIVIYPNESVFYSDIIFSSNHLFIILSEIRRFPPLLESVMSGIRTPGVWEWPNT